MTKEQFDGFGPMEQQIIMTRCREMGTRIEEFSYEDAVRLGIGVNRFKAIIGKDITTRPAKSDEEIEREEQQGILESFLRTVPARYRDADLSKDFHATFIEDLRKGQSAIVVGGNGIGKTRLAWALAQAWKREVPRCTVRIVKGAALLSEVKSIEGDWYRYIETEYGKCDHLFIDEIDKIKGSEADWMLLTYLIDYRYEWMRQTVVMGNCSKEETLNLIGQSSYSRLSGDGARAYSLSGTDKRRQDYRERCFA